MKILDMHCDTLYELMADKKKGEAYSLRTNNHHLDLMRMQEGDYLLQCFAVFVNMAESASPLTDGMKLVDLYYEELRKNKDVIAPVLCYEDIENNIRSGKMSAMLTGEEGQICDGSLEILRNYYRLGMRMMTLTWNHENQLGYPNNIIKDRENGGRLSHDSINGLKEKGFEFIAEMERLGMIIDVSHLSDAGFWDIYNHSLKPFAASHSNARAICPHPRNLTDDMIRAMADRGCVVGLNYCGAFLDVCGCKPGEHESRISDMVKHIKHITTVGGMDIMALGSDFDGIGGKLELNGCSQMPSLVEALCRAGFHESDVDKILYKNALRVFKECLG
ncbi:MAG: dipeptidase [Lachnospiraceae bacterium]